MTAIEALQNLYRNGEPLTDLQTLVLIHGGEAEAAELAKMREVIEQLDASTNKDEIDNAKSAAYEFLQEYPNA